MDTYQYLGCVIMDIRTFAENRLNQLKLERIVINKKIETIQKGLLRYGD